MTGKIILLILFLVGVCGLSAMIRKAVLIDYQYETKYGYMWELADKSSTIPAKAKYISDFVAVLEKNSDEFEENDAIWLKTPNNSFKNNLDALKTLNQRLFEISTMNVKDFSYQVAIQQITAQEQGEAKNLISVITGCYSLHNAPFVCGWIGGLWIALFIILMVVGGIGFLVALSDY